MEEERKDYESKMKVMKSEMELVFEAKVNEKIKRLTDSKNEVSQFVNIQLKFIIRITSQLFISVKIFFCS